MPTATRAQVDELMLKAFFPGRPARSSAYKAGVIAKLRRALQGERLACPYQQGSAEFDAFFSGMDEGTRIAQAYMAAQA